MSSCIQAARCVHKKPMRRGCAMRGYMRGCVCVRAGSGMSCQLCAQQPRRRRCLACTRYAQRRARGNMQLHDSAHYAACGAAAACRCTALCCISCVHVHAPHRRCPSSPSGCRRPSRPPAPSRSRWRRPAARASPPPRCRAPASTARRRPGRRRRGTACRWCRDQVQSGSEVSWKGLIKRGGALARGAMACATRYIRCS